MVAGASWTPQPFQHVAAYIRSASGSAGASGNRPGLRPRLPIAGTRFLDISAPVIERLNARGGSAIPGEITALPYHDGEFGLVCAFDVIEHAEDDQQAFRELSRVLQDGAVLVFSVPLHEKYWTGFDDCVGHARRYEPAALLARIEGNGLTLEKSAAFGMAPRNPRLLKFGMDALAKHRGGNRGVTGTG